MFRGRFILVLSSLLFITMVSGLFNTTAFAGAKKKIGVTDFENHSQIGGLGAGTADMMVVELVKNKNYDVEERGKLRSILSEQQLAATGAVSQQNAARLGELIGLNYLVVGAISSAEVTQVNKILFTETQIKVVVSMRLIDATTGTIVLADTAEGVVSRKSMVDENGRTIFGHNIVNDIGSYSEAAHKAVCVLVNKINTVNPLEGYILKVSGRRAYIDLGIEEGVQPGQTFEIFREGSPIIHPVTGQIMGMERQTLSMMKIVSIEGNMAIGEANEGSVLTLVSPGDRVRKR